MGYYRTGANGTLQIPPRIVVDPGPRPAPRRGLLVNNSLQVPGPRIVVDPGPRPAPRRVLLINNNLNMGDDVDVSQLPGFIDQTNQIQQQANDQITAVDEVSQLVSTVTGLFDGGAPTSDLGLVFNTSKYPGICKAGDRNTLNAVIAFQKQLNRVAAAKGLPKIANDGDLGPSTMTLYSSVNNAAGGSISTGFGVANCTDITNDLVSITARIKGFADSLGAAHAVSAPAPARTPSFVDPTTQKEVTAPGAGTSLPDMFNAMSTPMKVAFVGLVAGAGYFVFFKKKRAAASSRRTRR